MTRLKKSRSIEKRSRDNEEAIKERKRRKFLDFLEGKKSKSINKLQKSAMVKHDGGACSDKENLQNVEEEKPTKNGQQFLTVVSATQCDNGNVSQGLGRPNGSHKKDYECGTRSEIRRRPITRSSIKAARILKKNSLGNPMITMNAEPKLNQDNMSVETITEISKPSSQTQSLSRRPSTGSSTKAIPAGPIPASQNRAAKLRLCSTCNKSFPKSALFTDPGNNHFMCSVCRRKSKAVDTVPPLNIDFQTHTVKSPVGCPKQQNYIRGKDITGRTPDTAVKLDSSDEEEEAVNGTRSAINSRRQHSQSHLQRPVKRIAYPSRTDPEAIEISDSDLQHLEPTEFLNDTIIDFYIKYIQRELLSLESDSRFHFFSSFFYKKLSGVAGKKKKNKVSDFSKLRKWSKGINIFEKDYLIIPVHDKLHWSLAIICFPGHGPGSSSRSERCILHLDSMICGHQSDAIFRLLRRYLVAEWKDTFGEVQMERDDGIDNLTGAVIPGKKVSVPLQENESDCGLFLLHYIQKFVESAPKTMKAIDLKHRLKRLGVFGREWFSPGEASNLRTFIQEKLQSLFAENEVVVGKTSSGNDDIVKPRKLEAEFRVYL